MVRIARTSAITPREEIVNQIMYLISHRISGSVASITGLLELTRNGAFRSKELNNLIKQLCTKGVRKLG